MKKLIILNIFLIGTATFAASSFQENRTDTITIDSTDLNLIDSTTSTEQSKDSLSPAEKLKIAKEKAVKDSLEFEGKKLKAILRSTMENGLMTIQPASVDSIVPVNQIEPYHVMQTDGLNFHDVLNKSPLYLPVLRNLTSGYNEALYYGLPFPLLPVRYSQEIVSAYPYRTPYGNRFSPKEIFSISKESEELSLELFPQDFLIPQTSFLWEGGISKFRENMLNVRFTRAITDKIQIGIFTNYQHLARTNFSHDRGDIYNFYRGIYETFNLDLSKISNTGFNPYLNEFNTAATLKYFSSDNGIFRFRYSYSDKRNDYPLLPDSSFQAKDTSSIMWKEDQNYIHDLNTGLFGKRILGNLYLNSQLFLYKQTNNLSPWMTADVTKLSGEKLSAGGGIKPYFLLKEKDTLGIKFSLQRDETDRHNASRYITQDTRIEANLHKKFNLGPLNSKINLSGGTAIVKMNDTVTSNFIFNTSFTSSLLTQKLTLSASRAITPPQIPFVDNISVKEGKDQVDPYFSFGGDLELNQWKQSLLLGYKGIRNLTPRTDSLFWSPGLQPYHTPKNTFMVSSILLAEKPVSLRSSWYFSDKKPYIKSKSTLLFHIHQSHKVQHTFLSFDFMYWSDRGEISYGGSNTWGAKIIDVNFHATVQIKTFRLFYKMDNIINRANTFVPGFYTPGLIVRWGFNWQITG